MHRTSQPSGSRSLRPPPRIKRQPFCSMICFKLFLAIFTMLLGVILALCINLFDNRPTYVKIETARPTETTSVTKSSHKLVTTTATTTASTTTRTTTTSTATTTTTTTTTPKPTTPSYKFGAYYIELNNTEVEDGNRLCLDHSNEKDKVSLYVQICNQQSGQEFEYNQFHQLRAQRYQGEENPCITVERDERNGTQELLYGTVKLDDCPVTFIRWTVFYPQRLHRLEEHNSGFCIKGILNPGKKVTSVRCDYQGNDTEYTWWKLIPK